MPTTDEARNFGPVVRKTGQELNLAMQRLWLMGRILPIGARLMVQHTFQCDATKPLEVIYTFPLPREGRLTTVSCERQRLFCSIPVKTR